MGSADYSFDIWLNTRLRDVPVPSGVLRRLREIPIAADTDLDAAVCDVPVPSGLQNGLHRIGQRHVRLARLGQMTATVSLATAVAFAYSGAVLVFLLNTYRPPNAPPPRLRQLETITQVFSAFGRAAGAEDQISLVTFQPFGEDVWSPGRDESPDAADPSLNAGEHPSSGGIPGEELSTAIPQRRWVARASYPCMDSSAGETLVPPCRALVGEKRWLAENFPVGQVNADMGNRA